MTTVFIGGSRHVSRLTAPIKERLNTIIEKRHHVVVGDANGADKAVQKHFADATYDLVTVYCSGMQPRNRLAEWKVNTVLPPKGVKGFQFYAAKDREMAAAADFGLMIWDGKSPGTVLNVLRLAQAGKIAVLVNQPDKVTYNIKSPERWNEFFAACEPAFRDDVRERATPSEWAFAAPNAQFGLTLEPTPIGTSESPLPPLLPVPSEGEPSSARDDLVSTIAINAALATADFAAFVDTLGDVARARGMSQIARDTGLSRESLYRSLGSGGNPEFATIMKVLSSLGLRLEANAPPNRA